MSAEDAAVAAQDDTGTSLEREDVQTASTDAAAGNGVDASGAQVGAAPTSNLAPVQASGCSAGGQGGSGRAALVLLLLALALLRWPRRRAV